NLGVALIADPEERLDLARMNLAAGRKAKAAAAYSVAMGYLGAGAALVGEEGWEQAHRLLFELCIERAECDFLLGRFDAAESTMRSLLLHAGSNLEKSNVYDMWSMLCSTQNRFREAVDLVLSGLALFGVEVPASEEARAALVEEDRAEVDRLLSAGPTASLVDAPVLADPSVEAVMRLLLDLSYSAYAVSNALTKFGALRLTLLSLK